MPSLIPQRRIRGARQLQDAPLERVVPRPVSSVPAGGLSKETKETMTRKTAVKKDRPGWKFYQARMRVNALIDALIMESFRTCRDANLILSDKVLHGRFCELRDAADRLNRELALRENAEINKERSRAE